MDEKALMQTLAELAGPPPADLEQALKTLPTPATLPSPWAMWTLVGLVRHLERQRWLAGIVRTRLGGSPERIAAVGTLGHPQKVARQGRVPGLPDWEYFFHGRGCCLTNLSSGESIDVNFHDDTAEHIDDWFYVSYLQSLFRPEPPEARLIALHPSIETVVLALDELREAGLLVSDPHHGAARLDARVLPHADVIAAVGREWHDPRWRLWQAALLGDWLAVREATVAAGLASLEPLASQRAEAVRDRRRARLDGALRGSARGDLVLRGLAELPVDDLHVYLLRVLRSPFSGATSAALELIDQSGNPAFCPAIFELMCRLDPKGNLPQPHLWITAADILLRHGHRADRIVAALPEAGGPEVATAALLALEYAPRLAGSLFERALRSEVPHNRMMAAAALALMDQPWCREMLVAVLRESSDPERTAECRAALRACQEPDPDGAVAAWELEHPHAPEPASPGSTREPLVRDCDDDLRAEMERLSSRVGPLRYRLPLH